MTHPLTNSRRFARAACCCLEAHSWQLFGFRRLLQAKGYPPAVPWRAMATKPSAEQRDALEARFNAAADAVALAVTGKHPAFTDALKLRFYGLYKQATVGPCTDKQPGIWNPAGRAKWWAFGRVGLLLAC